MRKGIIVEHKKRNTLMMTSDGSFYKTRKIDGSIGEETSFEPLTSPGISFDGLFQWINSFTQLKPIAAALIAILLFIPYYSWLGEDDVHAYVNIDINPSVELSVNDEYEVIGVEGINEDGRLLVQQLSDWEHQSIQKVSSKILSLSNQLGYLNENHQILLGISFVDQLSHGDDNLVLQEVSKQMETNFKSVSVASFEVPKDVREKAKKEKASMNLMYASEILENREAQQDNEAPQSSEEPEENQTEEKQSNENSKDTSQTSTDKSDQQSDSKIEDKNIEVIEKFLQKTNKEKLPPGLKKKLEKFQEKQQWDDFDKKEFRKNKDSNDKDEDEDHPSHKGKGKKDEDDDRAKKDKSKDDDHPSNKGEDHPSNEGKDDKKKKHDDNDDDEGWTPPGLKDKEKRDDRDRKGIWDFFDRNDREDEKKERGKGNKKDEDDNDWTPPGLDKKDKREDRDDDNRGNSDWDDDDRDDDDRGDDRDDD